MKIYIRKIDEQCISRQISYTNDILKNFLDNISDQTVIKCEGKNNHEIYDVKVLLATDPRFDSGMQAVLKSEGNLAVGDLMVMYKDREKYYVELVKGNTDRHNVLLGLFSGNERHALINVDVPIQIDITGDNIISEEDFIIWMRDIYKKPNGESLKDDSQISDYYILKSIPSIFACKSVFSCASYDEYHDLEEKIRNSKEFFGANKLGNGALSAGLTVLGQYYKEKESLAFPSYDSLIAILLDWYTNKPIENSVSSLVGFGLKYAEAIRYYGKLSKEMILDAGGIPEADAPYINRGLDLYDAFKNNTVGIIFADRDKKTFGGKVIYKAAIDNKGFALNRIVFGAPGTGKSFEINKNRIKLLDANQDTNYERVTFHPDYSYANFVGTYKPVPYIDLDGKESITYKYVPGPFMRVYVSALKSLRTNKPEPYILIIEEINRANVAAVFGDVFQLLDRDKDGVSEYAIQASEDMKKYLQSELGGNLEDYSNIKIPNNMFIWATMNSADQGVFPMDTAFKRRWSFEYIGVNDGDSDIVGKEAQIASDLIEWNKLRVAINNYMLSININEDKLLGPYFIYSGVFDGPIFDNDKFIKVFKNKVIMYLFEDAVRQKRKELFSGCSEENRNIYSGICNEFDVKGIEIFNQSIVNEARI